MVKKFDINKFNERFNTVGVEMENGNVSDNSISDNDSIVFDKKFVEKQADDLIDKLNRNTITDAYSICEDLLKLVFIDVFNKDWDKHNYILSNATINKSSDSGLLPVTVSCNIVFDKPKENYTRDDLKVLLLDFITRLRQECETVLMRHLCRQFTRIVNVDLHGKYQDYTFMLNSTRDSDLLKYFATKSPEMLARYITIEVGSKWDWLPLSESILDERPINENKKVFQISAINRISYSFDNMFIEECLEDLKQLFENNKLRRFTKYESFETVCERISK